MVQAYKAVLRGNNLEWLSEAPESDLGHPLTVQVTLDEQCLSAGKVSRGPAMAEILEKLAQSKAFAEISDPVAWQREMRKDRELPGRDD